MRLSKLSISNGLGLKDKGGQILTDADLLHPRINLFGPSGKGAEGFSNAIVLLQHIGAVVAQSKKVTIKAPPGEHSVKMAGM